MPNETPSLIAPQFTQPTKVSVTDDNALDIINQDDETPDLSKTEIPSPDETPDDETPDDETPAEEEAEETPADEDEEENPDEELDASATSLIDALKKTDPEIFKKHPELRKVIYKEQQYASIFPTLEEAREVAERHEGFSRLESEIMGGKPENLISALAKTDENALYEFSNNFLPTLAKANKDVYSEVLQVPLKRAIQNVYLEGKRTNNENLQNAALFVDQALFDGGIGELPKGRVKTEENPEVTRLKKERDEHSQRSKDNFNTEVIELIAHITGKEVRVSLEKYQFNEYERKNIVRDITTEIQKMLGTDKRYQVSMASLMKQAESAGFTSDWKARVSNAFLARAKAVLPIAKKKVIAEVTGKKEKLALPKRVVPSNSSSRVPSTLDVDKIDRSKTTMLDIINDKITLRS